MKLSERQKKIVEIVKLHQPLSGEKISELLDISRATLRPDLSFLTLVGILKATPKIGYTYSGLDLETLFFFDTFQKEVVEIMTSPVLVTHDSYIQDAIITLFMYDADVLYVIDEDKLLLGIMSRKDLLRASLNSSIQTTPVAVCMTRMPHIITCTKDMNILEAAALLQDHAIDSLPVVDEEKEIIVYSISDSLGGTSQKLLSAVTAQYPDIIFNNSYRFPFINQEEELLDILYDALKDNALVISTLVNSQLASVAREFSQKNGLAYLDLMHPFFEIIEEKTGTRPIEVPGTLHRLDSDYFKKISAIEFAVKYDDGKAPQGFLEADLVLLGVSRTSKTPLSIYLANKGYKVANLPLIPEVPLPQVLDKVDSHRLIGLICEPEKLMKVRSHRLDSLGLTQETSYTDLEKIYQELDYSKKVFKQFGAQVINMTDKSIEETAFLIEEQVKKMN